MISLSCYGNWVAVPLATMGNSESRGLRGKELSSVFLFFFFKVFLVVCLFVCFVFLSFLEPRPWYMEVPRLGDQSEL